MKATRYEASILTGWWEVIPGGGQMDDKDPGAAGPAPPASRPDPGQGQTDSVDRGQQRLSAPAAAQSGGVEECVLLWCRGRGVFRECLSHESPSLELKKIT